MTGKEAVEALFFNTVVLEEDGGREVKGSCETQREEGFTSELYARSRCE